jgi:hypothetical protein
LFVWISWVPLRDTAALAVLAHAPSSMRFYRSLMIVIPVLLAALASIGLCTDLSRANSNLMVDVVGKVVVYFALPLTLYRLRCAAAAQLEEAKERKEASFRKSSIGYGGHLTEGVPQWSTFVPDQTSLLKRWCGWCVGAKVTPATAANAPSAAPSAAKEDASADGAVGGWMSPRPDEFAVVDAAPLDGSSTVVDAVDELQVVDADGEGEAAAPASDGEVRRASQLSVLEAVLDEEPVGEVPMPSPPSKPAADQVPSPERKPSITFADNTAQPTRASGSGRAAGGAVIRQGAAVWNTGPASDTAREIFAATKLQSRLRALTARRKFREDVRDRQAQLRFLSIPIVVAAVVDLLGNTFVLDRVDRGQLPRYWSVLSLIFTAPAVPIIVYDLRRTKQPRFSLGRASPTHHHIRCRSVSAPQTDAPRVARVAARRHPRSQTRSSL